MIRGLSSIPRGGGKPEGKEGGCITMLGALRPIEGAWVRTKLIRGVLRPDGRHFGACLTSHSLFRRRNHALVFVLHLFEAFLDTTHPYSERGGATGADRVSAERGSQSTQPRARCSPFGRGAWRQVASPKVPPLMDALFLFGAQWGPPKVPERGSTERGHFLG